MHEQNRPNLPALDPPANTQNAAAAPTTAHSAAGVPHNAGTSETIKKEVNDQDGDFCEEITYPCTYPPRETLTNKRDQLTNTTRMHKCSPVPTTHLQLK